MIAFPIILTTLFMGLENINVLKGMVIQMKRVEISY